MNLTKKNNYTTNKDTLLSGVENTIRTGFQLIPVLGGALNQIIFGFNDIQQIKRIGNFLVDLSNYLQNEHIQKDTLDKLNRYMNTNDGKEYLYLTLDKARKIRNIKKLKYLRNLFLSESFISESSDLDISESFLNTLENLDIKSIEILDFLEKYTDSNLEARAPMIGTYDNGVNEKIEEQKPYIEVVSEKVNLDKDSLTYNHQQLINEGLIYDNGIGRMNTDALQTFIITKRGCALLSYIKEDSQS